MLLSKRKFIAFFNFQGKLGDSQRVKQPQKKCSAERFYTIYKQGSKDKEEATDTV